MSAPAMKTGAARKRGPLPVSPAELRKQAADEIERLIAFIDRLDGDPDLESGEDDEPSLAGPYYAGIGGGLDLEDDQTEDRR